MTERSVWGSRLGFILASAGSAVGLGAIWKFPYMAGTNGGSIFMLPYIFFTVTIGLTLLIGEMCMGRSVRAGAAALPKARRPLHGHHRIHLRAHGLPRARLLLRGGRLVRLLHDSGLHGQRHHQRSVHDARRLRVLRLLRRRPVLSHLTFLGATASSSTSALKRASSASPRS